MSTAGTRSRWIGRGHVKRIGSHVLLFVGVFLLVLGISVKFFVAPRAVKAPLQIPEKYRTIIATGENFQFLNAKTLQPDNISVYITRHIQGDVSKGNSKVAVYQESLCLTRDDGTHPGCVDKNDDRLITNSTDQVAFDRISGMAVNDAKYGESVDGDPTIKHSGLGYKFPIDSKKKTYPYFDTVVGKAFPMEYKGSEKLEGLRVYRYVQTIVDQPVYTNHVLPSTYTNTRTVWVEPTTGAIVKGREDLTQTLTGRADLDATSELRDPVLAGKVALKGVLQFDDNTVKLQAQLAKDNLPKVAVVRFILPLVSFILGLILTVLAFFRLRGRQSAKHGGGSPAPQVPVGSSAP
jgi:hypothetical protein